MSTSPTAPIAAAGLAGGFAVAKYSGRRELGGLVFAAAGAVCVRSWWRSSGPAATVLLAATYVAAMGGSHPLAKQIGAWPAVGVVTTVASGAAYVLADRN